MIRGTLLMINLEFLSQCLNSFFRKWEPWSVIKIFGHSNLDNVYSKINFESVSALQSLTGCASAHFVKKLVVVIRYYAPILFLGGLMGPTKSIAHLSKACNVTCGTNGISSILEGFLVL